MQEDLRLLCTDGCKPWTLENARSDECRTGKSASNALVARKDYANTQQLEDLLDALNLGSSPSE